MIDIHHHCLPGVDDGPREWDEAVAMCRHGGGRRDRDDHRHAARAARALADVSQRAELESRLAELRREVGDIAAPRPRLRVLLRPRHAPEVLRAGDADHPARREPLRARSSSPANSVPPMFEQPLYRMQLDGWIADHRPSRAQHRLPGAARSCSRRSIEHGARMQITAGSLTGEFGPRGAAARRNRGSARGLVHFVATDAHNIDQAAAAVAEALAALRELAGDAVAEALTVRKSARGRSRIGPCQYDPEPAEAASAGFLTRLRAFFGSQIGPTIRGTP